MPLLEIDQSLCEGCGLCVTDCIAGIIEQNESGFPSISPEKEKLCYKCQHCLAVCPTGALSILGKNPSDSLDLSQLSLPSYEQTDNFIRSRRSIRSYEDKNVDPALLEKLLKTLAFAPTGSNCQELTFNLIDDKREMRKFSELLADSVVEASKDENVVRQIPRIKVFARYPKEELISMMFRNAPHALIVSAAPDASCPQEDVAIALSYFEFLATSAGLGVLWWGLLKFALAACPELKIKLGIPEDHHFYGMLFGIPSIQYARTTQKEDVARVRRVTF
jgi:nitroreductase/NAD-dependent dihydropyrimidine dehydrogenase PreA subunit